MDGFYIVVLISTALVLLAAFSSLIAFRFGAPLLLLFLAVGLMAGTDGLGIEFDNGALAYTLGSIALAVILFDSGFGTSLQSFRTAAFPAIALATVGVIITASLIGLAAMFLFSFSWIEGLLIGSIIASTDAAAVFFLLRIGGINIRDKVRSTLEVESGTNDPMAIFLTITLVELIAKGAGTEELDFHILLEFGREMGLGAIIGFLGGMLIVEATNRFVQDRGLAPIIVLALALLVFSAAGVAEGSGFLAVYVAGLYAGNKKLQSQISIKRFQDGMTWLAQIIMFLVLGLLATPSEFPAILLPAMALAFVLIFIARPLAVWLCLMPFDFSQKEITFVAWVGLRGAVSILLGILPVLGGVEHGQDYFNVTFIVVLVSLILQGWTIKFMAKRLSLIVPPRIGAVDRLEVDLPMAAHHELVAYRVIKDSPVMTGTRIPRWATPSLVVRDGRSMRNQYAGKLIEGDLVYLFITPPFIPLLDRLFASRAAVDPDDVEFFGTFAVSPSKPASDLDLAYGPGLLNDSEKAMTIGELVRSRLGGKAEYADRLRLGSIQLIVRDVDDNNHVSAIGISMEPVESARLPLFINFREINERLRGALKRRRQK